MTCLRRPSRRTVTTKTKSSFALPRVVSNRESAVFSGNGRLNFDSFFRVASHFQEEDDEALQKELKEAFRLYDKEGNGYIPTSSLREILAALDDQITPDQMDGMIAEIDTDGSGTVDFDGKFRVFHDVSTTP